MVSFTVLILIKTVILVSNMTKEKNNLRYSGREKDDTPDFDVYLEKYGDSDTALFKMLIENIKDEWDQDD